MQCVKNPRLAKAVKEIDQHKDREKALGSALKDKEFREFADHCLKTLGFLDETNQFTYDAQ